MILFHCARAHCICLNRFTAIAAAVATVASPVFNAQAIPFGFNEMNARVDKLSLIVLARARIR